MRKECLHCKTEFEKDCRTSKKHFLTLTKFCSLKCKWAWMSETFVPPNKNKIAKICEVCKKDFEVSPYRKNEAKFCSRKCHGSTRKKEKGINWRGGITPINYAIRESLEYKEWRSSVFERDNYTCQVCGEIGGKLEADHIKMFSKFPELRFELSNGQTLCKSCHKIKTVKDMKINWKNQFKESYSLEGEQH